MIYSGTDQFAGFQEKLDVLRTARSIPIPPGPNGAMRATGILSMLEIFLDLFKRAGAESVGQCVIDAFEEEAARLREHYPTALELAEAEE